MVRWRVSLRLRDRRGAVCRALAQHVVGGGRDRAEHDELDGVERLARLGREGGGGKVLGEPGKQQQQLELLAEAELGEEPRVELRRLLRARRGRHGHDAREDVLQQGELEEGRVLDRARAAQPAQLQA